MFGMMPVLRTRRNVLLICLLIQAVVSSALPHSILASPKELSGITARNACLIDAATGKVLYGREMDEVVAPASLTKIMTLKLAYEAIDKGTIRMTDLVPVSTQAWRTGGSRMFLSVGSKVPLEEILKGIAVVSGNDACVALAEFIGGTVENFVSMMNTRAQQLGLTTARFVDPHGISDQNRISAREVAMLARAYINDHPQSLKIHSMQTYTHTPLGARPITQHNRNKLLGQYNGADGLKTGFTQAAGYNLVGTAERGGTRFIGVVLGVRANTDPAGELLRAQEMSKILDYGFNNFVTLRLYARDESVGSVRVYKGKADSVTVVVPQEIKAIVPKGSESRVTRQVNIADYLVAPVKKRQSVGTITVTLDGETLVSDAPVLALEDVQPGGFFKRLLDSLRLLRPQIIKR